MKCITEVPGPLAMLFTVREEPPQFLVYFAASTTAGEELSHFQNIYLRLTSKEKNYHSAINR